MALRVTLAGRVGIEVDGEEVAAAGLGRPGRLALAYLTCERHRSVSRDELGEVLGGEERPQSADQMLRGWRSSCEPCSGSPASIPPRP